jgi:hypothetical protein
MSETQAKPGIPLKRISLLLLSIAFSSASFAQDTKLTADEIIRKSLDSMGPASARSAIPFLDLSGPLTVKTTRADFSNGSGTAHLLSQGEKFKLQLAIPSGVYRGETIVYDGKRTNIAHDSQGNYTPLGHFFDWQPVIVADGLIGGELSMAWPLGDPSLHGDKVSYDGLKKDEGRAVHQLTYRPKKADGSLVVRMLFDPETYRHVKTIYLIDVPPNVAFSRGGLGSKPTFAGTEELLHFRLEESFGDFKKLGNLTFPSEHKLKYTSDAPGETQNWTFEIHYNKLDGNDLK